MSLKKGPQKCDSPKGCSMSVPKSSPVKKVKFVLEAPNAKQVMVAGDFTKWAAAALKKSGSKLWEKDLTLQSGRYEYKFVVDGKWINDPKNSRTVSNSFGSQNSVLEI